MLRRSYRRGSYGFSLALAGRARGKDGALSDSRRARIRTVALVVVLAVSVAGLTTPAAALTPVAQADVAAFTSRAEAWTEARDEYRDDARAQALALADDARQAEADRVAAEEAAALAAAERRAEEAVARTTTTTTTPPTTAPPTTAPPTTTAAPSAPTPAADPSPSGAPTASQFAALRGCESSGNYGAVSSNSRYRGAYQFSQATWDWIAGLDRPALVGIDPAAAAPADQDAMALALWQRRGWSPWPLCGPQAAAS